MSGTTSPKAEKTGSPLRTKHLIYLVLSQFAITLVTFAYLEHLIVNVNYLGLEIRAFEKYGDNESRTTDYVVTRIKRSLAQFQQNKNMISAIADYCLKTTEHCSGQPARRGYDIEVKPLPLRGPPGPPGPKGNSGVPGSKGDIGPVGKPGLLGQKGNSGSQGSPGPTGPKGDPGLPGSKGDVGSAGNPGLPGQKGASGSQGLPGLIGSRGDSGLPGSKGAVGPAGMPGLPGEKGIFGRPGWPGLKGEQGFPGLQGPPGPQGLQGKQGFTGLQGLPGLQGMQGPQGNAFYLCPTPVESSSFLGEMWKAKAEIFLGPLQVVPNECRTQ